MVMQRKNYHLRQKLRQRKTATNEASRKWLFLLH